MADISKITLSGTTYNLKDATARSLINSLESAVSGGLQIVVVSSLPTAAAATTGKIYLLPSEEDKQNNIYDEYLTVNLGNSSSPNYKWEKIGNTDVDLSGYSTKGHTHSVTTSVTANQKLYTPAGSVTLPSFSSSVTPSKTDALTLTQEGTEYSLTGGSVSKAADSKSNFATSGITASYVAETEALVLGTASTAQAVTASGNVTYTRPSLTGSLPAFGTQKVLSGVTVTTTASGNASFSGTQADITPTLTNGAIVTLGDE